MSLDQAFNAMFATRAAGPQQITNSFLGMSLFGGASKGTLANVKSAFTISAFYNGVEQLSNDIAKLPKSIKQKIGADRVDFTDHPVNYLIASQPNDMMTAFDFWKVNVVSVIIKGNSFSRIMRNADTGEVKALLHLNSEDVQVLKYQNRLFYKYKGETIDSADMLHFKHLSFDGIIGVSVIAFAAKQLGVTIDAQTYQQEVYKDRGLGYGVIESDLAVKKETKIMIEDGFSAKMASSNKFKVPMLDEGMKYKSISISPAEAQFLETNKSGVIEVCRWLNIAPHKLKDLNNANYSNIQQQSIEHVQDSLLPWIVRMEQEISNKIFTTKEKASLYVKFNEKSLLRGDLEARKNYYTAMVYAGIMTRNEARALEDMNGLDGLDEILQPVNMQALSIANELIKNTGNGTSGK
jgi:HK97 family phage portal protein